MVDVPPAFVVNCVCGRVEGSAEVATTEGGFCVRIPPPEVRRGIGLCEIEGRVRGNGRVVVGPAVA
jgi:hypothetical protein